MYHDPNQMYPFDSVSGICCRDIHVFFVSLGRVLHGRQDLDWKMLIYGPNGSMTLPDRSEIIS